jgi:hypothetical protein
MTALCGFMAVGMIWLLSRPYHGIIHDSRIYVGRALADLDPQGIGRQLGFVEDHQSEFSIFAPLVAPVLKTAGPGTTALLLSFLALVLWLTAACFLATRLLKGRDAVLALVCLAVLPLGYGGCYDSHTVFRAGEAFLTPRPFAEAAGLAALAFFLDGRRLAGAVLWIIAMALHPIMALGVGAVGLTLLVMGDRRWLWLVSSGGAVVVIAALLGLPVVDRLLIGMDPTWRAMVTPELFPMGWQLASWSLLACQLTTLLLARRYVSADFRSVILAVTIVGCGGILISAIVPSLLVVQVQAWRSQWLLAVLAALAFAPFVTGSWRAGGFARASAALLLVAWVDRYSAVPALVACAGAVALAALATRPGDWRMASLLVCVFSLSSVVALEIKLAMAEANRNAGFPPGLAGSLPDLLKAHFLKPAIVTGAVALGLLSRRLQVRSPRALSLGIALALAPAVALTWDERGASVRAREVEGGDGALQSVIKSGQVYWLGSPGDMWLVTGRPEWWNDIEGAGGVFDRRLLREWDRRLRVLIGAGFVTVDGQSAINAPASHGLRALVRLCTSPGGPDWVVLPKVATDPSALPLARAIWRAPTAEFAREPAGAAWLDTRVHAIFACVDLRDGGQSGDVRFRDDNLTSAAQKLSGAANLP